MGVAVPYEPLVMLWAKTLRLQRQAADFASAFRVVMFHVATAAKAFQVVVSVIGVIVIFVVNVSRVRRAALFAWARRDFFARTPSAKRRISAAAEAKPGLTEAFVIAESTFQEITNFLLAPPLQHCATLLAVLHDIQLFARHRHGSVRLR